MSPTALQPGRSAATEPTHRVAPQGLGTDPESGGAFAQHVAWMGIELALPRAWACVRHACNPNHGALVFADRLRPRLQLRWDTLKEQDASTFEAHRVLNNYRHAVLAEDEDSEVCPVHREGPWAWVTRRRDDGSVLGRALRLDSFGPRVVEITVTDPPCIPEHPSSQHGHTQATLSPTIDTAQLLRRAHVRCAADEATQWRLLGLHAHTPAGWTPHRIVANPADVSLCFSIDTKPHRPVVAVRRRGLLDAWFDGDLAKTLREQHSGRQIEIEPSPHPDFDTLVSGRANQPRWQRLLRPRVRAVHGRVDHDRQHLLTLELERRAARELDPADFRCALDTP